MTLQGAELGLQQSQTLHGQLGRALQLLRAPGPELEQMLRAALAENLLLEAEQPRSGEERASPADAGAPGLPEARAEEPNAARPARERGAAPDSAQREPADPSDTALARDLSEQLALCPGAAGMRELCEAIVASLDEEGYLMDGLAEVVAWAPGDHTLKQARAALALIQSLEPAGVGARDLAECLRLQLMRLPEDAPGRAVALRIARYGLPLLAAGKESALRRRLRLSRTRFKQAADRIRECDPRPGRALDRTQEQPLVPDLIVVRGAGGWRVELNDQASLGSRLRVNEVYARAVSGEHAELKEQLREARWLVQALKMRRRTLLRVAGEIVRRQERWLSEGDTAMAPLRMRDAAEALGVHETTVSRAVAGKYMQTPQGLAPLRQFFSAGLSADGGARASSAVQARIREIIQAENPARPLSDEALAGRLAGEGVQVARRTVAKYRGSMRIPPASRRRASA